jgi:hypothetical protein
LVRTHEAIKTEKMRNECVLTRLNGSNNWDRERERFLNPRISPC